MCGTQARVSVIPAAEPAGGRLAVRTGLRVAAYCRVSTDEESQQTSFAVQQDYYTRFIRSRPGWIFAGIYADEGISGTSAARREAFSRMIRDAKDGKLDYIVTKSISRFARNTVLTLNCARELRQLDPPVGIWFEKENLDTLDAAGELLLTILSALAQDESRSISENIRWSIRKKFEAGEPIVNLSRMIGYDRAPDGTWIINEAQAETVRQIFEAFATGESASRIAGTLNEAGRLTVNGCRWTACSVMIVLRNEKYVGDAEMQKYVTKDFLTHRSVRNNGEAPKYYVRDHHAPIISRALWNTVQARLREGQGGQREKKDPQKPAAARPVFSGLRCGICGRPYRRVTQGNALRGYSDGRSAAASGLDPDRYREHYRFYNPVWICAGRAEKRGSEKRCTAPVLVETALEQSFMEMLWSLKRDWEAKGEESVLCTLFRRACAERDSSGESSTVRLRIAAVNGQIAELKQIGSGQRAESLLEKLMRERDTLEQNTSAAYQRRFDRFLDCLAALPEQNAAGRSLRVFGLDAGGSAAPAGAKGGGGRTADFPDGKDAGEAPDFLPFDRSIFEAFITGGTVHGDAVRWTTNFGISLACVGCGRTLPDFRGFRRCGPDGTEEILTELQQICGAPIRYTRRPK